MSYDWDRELEDERSDRLATEGEADAEYARNVGGQYPDRAWILSDRDAWYANPFYVGPPQRHPEEYGDSDDEIDAIERAQLETAFPSLTGGEQPDEDDGQPDEAQEWHDFDPDC